MATPWQVLIVGKDAECANVLAKGLRAFLPPGERPTRTTLSRSPEAALRLLGTLPDDRLVVVADEDLAPTMSGAELLHVVGARRAGTRRVLLCACAIGPASDPRVDHAVETPFRLRELVQRLARLAA